MAADPKGPWWKTHLAALMTSLVAVVGAAVFTPIGGWLGDITAELTGQTPTGSIEGQVIRADDGLPNVTVLLFETDRNL